MTGEARPGEDLLGVVQHLHQVLLVSHSVALLLSGGAVARPPPELVPGLEVLSLSLVLLSLPGRPGVPLLLHLTRQLAPVLSLVPLHSQSVSQTNCSNI